MTTHDVTRINTPATWGTPWRHEYRCDTCGQRWDSAAEIDEACPYAKGGAA